MILKKKEEKGIDWKTKMKKEQPRWEISKKKFRMLQSKKKKNVNISNSINCKNVIFSNISCQHFSVPSMYENRQLRNRKLRIENWRILRKHGKMKNYFYSSIYFLIFPSFQFISPRPPTPAILTALYSFSTTLFLTTTQFFFFRLSLLPVHLHRNITDISLYSLKNNPEKQWKLKKTEKSYHI